MNVLAVDTTGETLSVALSSGGKIRVASRKGIRIHDSALIPTADLLLTKAKLKIFDLDAVAVACGPGRFTGIRIGMAYAAVLASQLEIPALAISLFEVIAHKTQGKKVLAVVEGWREEKFHQSFSRKNGSPPKAAGDPVWILPDAWPKTKSEALKMGVVVAAPETRAKDLIAPALLRLCKNKIPKFEPLYLKLAGYEIKRKVVR